MSSLSVSQPPMEQHFAPTNPDVTATVNKVGNPKKRSGAHPIQQFLHNLSKKLPKVNEEGMVYVIKEGTTGKQAANQSVTLGSQKDIRRHLEGAFPNYPTHFAADPKKRAEKHRNDSFWTYDNMIKAHNEFVIPSELKTIFICPEI